MKKTAVRINELIDQQLTTAKEMNETSQKILETITPFIKELTDEKNVCALSFISLINVVKKILSFDNAFVRSSNHSLPGIADLTNSSEGLFSLFSDLESKIPTQQEIEKIRKSKSHKAFIEKLNADNVDLLFWFFFPYTFVSNWSRFWTQVLEYIPIEDQIYSVYKGCRSIFKKIEQERNYIRVAELFKKQKSKLVKWGKAMKVFIPLDTPLLWCVSGRVLVQPQPIPAWLFIFEDRVIVAGSEKFIISSPIINTWIVQSAMYPASRHVVDVLSTKVSYAFEPASESESEALWKHWTTVEIWCPEDWSIFQPVIINAKEENTINWEIVNK